MTSLTQQVAAAKARAGEVRPKVGGFPFLAEALRQAGISFVRVNVPAMSSVYEMSEGQVLEQGKPQAIGELEVPAFDEAALVTALRTDQAGLSAFPEFMAAAWAAGVLNYEVDLNARSCTYHSAIGQTYVEEYPSVELPPLPPDR